MSFLQQAAKYGNVYNQVTGTGDYQKSMTSFSGADLKAVFGGVEIGELQQVSWSVVREKGGNYVLGQEDPISFSRGRRFIAGMFMFGFFAKEALLVSMRNARAAGSGMKAGQYYEWTNERSDKPRAGLAVPGVANLDPREQDLSRSAEFLLQEARELPRRVVFARYADQLQPFNVTLTVCNEYGVAARMAILGIEIMNMESGFAIETMQADHRYTFIAREVTQWQRVDQSGLNLSDRLKAGIGNAVGNVLSETSLGGI